MRRVVGRVRGGGGWANSVHVDVSFMWVFRSCGCLNRFCMLRVAKGSGGGGGGLIPFVWMFRSCGCFACGERFWGGFGGVG